MSSNFFFRKLYELVLEFVNFEANESKTQDLVKSTVNGYLEEAGLFGEHYTVTDQGSNMVGFGRFSLYLKYDLF